MRYTFKPAKVPLLPDAYCLLLVGQVNPSVVVEGLHCASARWVKEVLRAALGGEVGVSASVLRNLQEDNSIGLFPKKKIWKSFDFQTFIDQLLAAMPVPMPVVPRLKLRVLHCGLASTYTEKVCVENCSCEFFFAFFVSSLCSPVFSPHMVGGELPPGFVTKKVSVWHCVLEVADSTSEVGSVARPPFRMVTWVVVATTGPVMENVWKSSRS